MQLPRIQLRGYDKQLEPGREHEFSSDPLTYVRGVIASQGTSLLRYKYDDWKSDRMEEIEIRIVW